MSYDYSRNCAVDIAKTILTARHETKSARPEYVTYDEICAAWNEYRYDRRYKLRIGVGTDWCGLAEVGKSRYYYELYGNVCHIRLLNRWEPYGEKHPCFQVELSDMGDYYTFTSEYQYAYQI